MRLLSVLIFLMATTPSGTQLLPLHASSVILHKNVPGVLSSISCNFPPNMTFPAEVEIEWTAPPGVLLTKNDIDLASPKPEQSGTSWVQQTSNNSLIFHNPDDKMAGSYVCRVRHRSDILFDWTVWVHVQTKPSTDTNQRINVAFISAGVAVCVILLCCGLVYWYRKNKCRYGKGSKPQSRNTFIIPTINVVDMSEAVTMMDDTETHNYNHNNNMS